MNVYAFSNLPTMHHRPDVSVRHLRQTVPKNHLLAASQEIRVRQGSAIRMYDVPCQVQAQTQSTEALQRSRIHGSGELRLTKTMETREKAIVAR